jgi:hypothetical protein
MKNYIPKYDEFVNEDWIGPFVFNDSMKDEELKAMYQGALDGFAYWQKGFEYPKADYKKAYQEIGKLLKKRGIKVDESVNEGAVKAFEMDIKQMIKDIYDGYGWIDPDYVEETWENSSDTIDFAIVKDEVFNRLIKAGMLYYPDSKDPEAKGKKITNINQIK